MNIRTVTTFIVVGEFGGIDKINWFWTRKGFFVMVVVKSYDSLPTMVKYGASLVLVNISSLFSVFKIMNTAIIKY